jgi:hypothetical protein
MKPPLPLWALFVPLASAAAATEARERFSKTAVSKRAAYAVAHRSAALSAAAAAAAAAASERASVDEDIAFPVEDHVDQEALQAEVADLRAQLASKNAKFLLQHRRAHQLAVKAASIEGQLREEERQEQDLRQRLHAARTALPRRAGPPP